MKRIISFVSFFCCFVNIVFAQQGKDGSPSITSTITVNIYTTLTASATAGTNTINVGSVAGLSAGDLLFIIQMQGAKVNANVYEWGNVNNALPNDTSFGKIASYNGTGNNEFAEITSISGNIVTLDCNLQSDYGADNSKTADSGIWRKTQVIRVPRYTSLALSGAGQITCQAWNGTTGGVAVVEVQGNTSRSNTGIDVSSKGFRGGTVLNASGYGATNTGANYGSSTANFGAHKGESIVGDTNVYKQINWFSNYSYNTPLPICKGNVANGGGGGNAMNCGGGGGSNGGVVNQWNGMGNPDNSTANNITAWGLESATAVNGSFRPTSSSGGGRGGYSFSSSNADPTVYGPNDNTHWASDSRHNDGGWGGIPLNYSTGKLFLGGGGGAGDSNDKAGTSGGNGGGMFYLLSYGTVSGAGQIIANGASAANTSTSGTLKGDDGAGGGGGGGTVIINSIGNIALTNTLAISAQGGKGGNYQTGNVVTTAQNYGPGGGGGGGYVALTNTVSGVNVNGGANGIVVNGGGNNTKISTKFPPNGATSGGVGTNTVMTSQLYSLVASNYTTCASSAATLSVTVNGNAPSGLSVMWYTASTGGGSIYTGNPYNFTAPATPGTYTYYAGACPGTSRTQVLLTVTSSATPTISVSASNTVVCQGTPVTLTVSGTATSYTWSANAGGVNTTTVTVTPSSNTTYSVAGTASGCGVGTATASIAISVNTSPTITITPSSYSICAGNSATLTASGSTSYTWSANAGNAITNTVVITPANTDTYTVTGGTGTCTGSQTVAISVTPNPTVAITPASAYICNGASTLLTASGASTYSWSTTAITNTISVSPSSNTVYTVTGFSASCSATKTVQVKVDAGINKADSTLTSATCGQSNGTYSLNSITGGISPYQINFNGTGFNTISAFSYTVGNLLGNNSYPIVLKDSLGCTYNTSVTIGNTSGIASMDTTVTKANCSPVNSGAIAINAVSGGTSPYQTSINGGSYNAISSFPYTYNNLTPGTYTVSVQDATNCPLAYVINVGVASAVTSMDTSVTNAKCSPANSGVIAINGVTGGTSPYQTSINGGSYNAISTFPYTYNNLIAGTYIVSVQDANNCPLSYTVNVNTVAGITVMDTVVTKANCSPANSGAIAINAISGGTAPYQTNINGGTNQTISTFPYTYSNLTTGVYTVSSQDANGCALTYTINVGTNSGVTAITYSAIPDTCNRSVGAIQNIAATGGVPTYSFAINGGTYQTTNSFNGLASGTYTIDAQDANGCVYTAPTITLTSTGTGITPTVTATGTTTVCQGGSVTLTSSSATSYTWSTGESTQTITVTAGGSYSVAVTSTNGCGANSNTVFVTVNPLPTAPTVNDTAISECSNAIQAINFNHSTGFLIIHNSAGQTQTIPFTPTVSGIYTAYDSLSTGCVSAVKTITVTISSAPNTAPTVQSPVNYCINDTPTALSATATAGANLIWEDANHNVISQPTPTTGSVGVQTYYVYQAMGTCVGTNFATVMVNVFAKPSPSFTFSPSSDISVGQSISFAPAQTSTANTYYWNFEDPHSSNDASSNITPTYVYNTAGTYCPKLVVSDSHCKDSIPNCLTVLSNVSMIIPNVFTPNGDGKNDVFSVNATGYTLFNCDIYDRWGIKLYEFTSVNGYWDGGKSVDGTYFYIIKATDVKGEDHTFNGFVELIK